VTRLAHHPRGSGERTFAANKAFQIGASSCLCPCLSSHVPVQLSFSTCSGSLGCGLIALFGIRVVLEFVECCKGLIHLFCLECGRVFADDSELCSCKFQLSGRCFHSKVQLTSRFYLQVHLLSTSNRLLSV